MAEIDNCVPFLGCAAIIMPQKPAQTGFTFDFVRLWWTGTKWCERNDRITHQYSSYNYISAAMTYRFDSKLTSYNVSGGMVASESRNYNNYDGRGRLTVEPCLYPGTGILSGSLNANFEFDESSGVNNEGGLGVRTRESILAKSGTTYGVKTIAQNGLNQVSQEFNSQANLPISGSTNIIYDSAGNVTSKYSTTTSGTQTLTWDAWGRLAKVSMRNSGTNDYDWTTVYDGLGRRVLTVQQPMNNGTNSTSSTYLNYYYDPQVEFLELGINNNGGRVWRVYGPDLSGRYGGAQGVGGIEAVVDEASGTVIAQTKDIFGNTVGGYINIFTTIPYSKTYAGYGPAFGTFLDYSKNGYPTPEWRGRYPDSTGFICMGGRYYDYQGQSGRFLSADPYGHAASMDLYSYASGDPINRLDPTGRCSNDQPIDLTLSGVVPTTDSAKRMQYYWNNQIGNSPMQNGFTLGNNFRYPTQYDGGFPTPNSSSIFRPYVTNNIIVGVEGSPFAYDPSDPYALNGAQDYLANAGHWEGDPRPARLGGVYPTTNWFGVATDNGKTTGNPLYNDLGNYVAATSWVMPGTKGWNQSDYVNGAVIPAVSLTDEQRGITSSNPKGDMRYGDFVWVVNQTTGMSTMAIYDDNRGDRSGIEISGATALNIGVPYGPGGSTMTKDTIQMYVFPGSRVRGFFPGGN